MDFEVKKAENCFSDAENYEYRIGLSGADFVEAIRLQAEQLHINDKLRRPTFQATLANGVQVKGLLERNVIKVGYVSGQAEEQKAAFEQWLANILT